MVLDRLLAEPELLRDLLVRTAGRDPLEDFDLAGRQLELVGDRVSARRATADGLRQDGALEDLEQDRGKLGRVDSLAEEGPRAAADRFGCYLGILDPGEHDHLDLRIPVAQPLEQLEPVDAGHPDVEENHIGI